MKFNVFKLRVKSIKEPTPKHVSGWVIWFAIYSAKRLHAGEAGVDLAEHVADHGAEDHQRSNNNDGDQNENQSVFDETLTFFLG